MADSAVPSPPSGPLTPVPQGGTQNTTASAAKSLRSPLLPSLALVALGGTVGTGAREALVLTIPDAVVVPWAIILANLAGAFFLGLLLTSLHRPFAVAVRIAGQDGSSGGGGSAGGGSAGGGSAGGGSAGALTQYRRLQLLLGTGFCGGFTTYSTLAVGVVAFSEVDTHGVILAAAYGLGSVVAGALVTWAGMAVGSYCTHEGHPHPRRPHAGRPRVTIETPHQNGRP